MGPVVKKYSPYWLTIFVLGFMVYGPWLRNPLLHYDDAFFISNYLPEAFVNFKKFLFAYSGNSFMPVSNLSMLLDYGICGGIGTCYHVTNLLFHILNTILVFWLLTEILQFRIAVAFSLALVFLSHLCLSEVVYWMGARSFSVQLFLCLLTLLALLKFRERPTMLRYVAVLLFFLLALGAKSLSIALVPLILVLWPFAKFKRPAAVMSLVPFALGLIFIFWTIQQDPDLSSPRLTDFTAMPLSDRLFVAAHGIIFYLQQTLFPWTSVAFYDVQRFELQWWEMGIAVLWVPIIALAFDQSREKSWMALIWVVAAMFPILKIIPFGENSAVNDRYLYACLPGLLVLMGLAWHRLSYRSPITYYSILACTLGLALLQGVRTYHQGFFWSSDEALWRHVLEMDPECSMAQTSLGRLYFSQGAQDTAEKHLEKALASRPDNAEALVYLAQIERNKKRLDRAIELSDSAIKHRPTMSEAYEVRGQLYLDKKDLLGAAVAFENCVLVAGVRPTCSLEAAKIYFALGTCEKARPHLEAALRHDAEADSARELITKCNQ